MITSEANRQQTKADHDKVRTALSLMPAMTSVEFYSQMEKSLGNKHTLIDPSNSRSSKSKRPGDKCNPTWNTMSDAFQRTHPVSA